MANYLGIKLDITDIPLSALKIGSYALVTFPTPPSPDPIYTFTYYAGIKLSDILDLSALKIGFILQQRSYNGIKLGMSDLPDISNLKRGVITHPANMAMRIYFRNFRVGWE